MAEEVLPGVYAVRIRGGYVNAFLIAGGGELTLVDSGLPGAAGAILAAVRRAGRRPEELRHIAVTHHHTDHAGSLAALVARTGATAYVHPLDAPVVRGDEPVPGPNPKSTLGKVIGPLIMRLQPARLPRVEISHEVTDGELLPAAGGLRAVHTPGHTPGHVAYLWPEHGGVLFAGDAAANLFGRLGLPALMFTQDMEAARASFRKLAELDFEHACFGHGGVLRGKAAAAFRRRLEKMAR